MDDFICDDVDNCPHTPNTGQEDRDGNGIGDVCDPSSEGDCNDVVVAGGVLEISISNIPLNARVRVGGNYICYDNCIFISQVVNGLSPGQYKVQIETFDPYCYAEHQVTVLPFDGPTPCANEGGDSDNDGICDDVDNCPNTPNTGQEDRDGNGIGDVCDPSSGGDCKDAQVAGGVFELSITNTPSNARIRVDDFLICEGNCPISQVVNGLSAGQHKVQIETFDPYCYAEHQVTVLPFDGPTPCADEGGDSDGDFICDDVDNCPNTPNTGQEDRDGNGIGDVCDASSGGDCKDAQVAGGVFELSITNTPLNARIRVDDFLICEGNCPVSQVVNGLSAGQHKVQIETFDPYCYAEHQVTVLPFDGPTPCADEGGDSDGDFICDDVDNCPNTPNTGQEDRDGNGIGDVCDPSSGGDCKDVVVAGGVLEISISNIPLNARVRVGGNYICYDNCIFISQVVNGLSPGQYKVQIETFDPYCYAEHQVTVLPFDGPIPCVDEGGDSDNDGICDDVDNCPNTWNPNQQDSNNDGIGDSCQPDDCTNIGDSDGDFICDDVDNCPNTPNTGQEDRDGNGIGDVCDPSSEGDCNDVVVAGGVLEISISNIPLNARVRVGGNYICYDNCIFTSHVINSVTAGQYKVQIETFDPYCYAEHQVTGTAFRWTDTLC